MQAPRLWIKREARSMCSSFIFKYFPIHSSFPNRPIQIQVIPPKIFPEAVAMVESIGSSPKPMQARRTASELKGRTVPAKKAEINIPTYPHSIRD